MKKKLCKKCNKLRPITFFHKNKAAKDGLQFYCKACLRSYVNNYQLLNKEKVQQYQRKYSRLNSEKLRQKALNYSYSTRGRETRRAYRIANREKLRQYSREYRRMLRTTNQTNKTEE